LQVKFNHPFQQEAVMKLTNITTQARRRVLALVLAALAGTAALAQATTDKVRLNVDLRNPVLLAGDRQKAFLRVGLEGFPLEGHRRGAVNLCLVLDRSGSMGGRKIEQAKDAAHMVVDMLGPKDIFSLVMYDDRIDVVVPATKLTNPGQVKELINGIYARGSTALFAGVSQGIGEVRKFLDRNRINRVILLSDGMANVGPSSPNELGRLGRSAGRGGIAVSTVGLGLDYNEDLMTRLAQNSDGNHAFAESESDLARIFQQELGDVLSVVAQDVEINITCDDEVVPVRVVDRDAEIRGQHVSLGLNQIYASQEKYLLLEVEVPRSKRGQQRHVADVEVSYKNMLNGQQERLKNSSQVEFTESRDEVDSHLNQKVVADTARSLANEQRKQAIVARDKGDVAGAMNYMSQSQDILQDAAAAAPAAAPALRSESKAYEKQSKDLKEEDWNKTRKSMKKSEYQETNQSSY
jgi:Ca-activated chloride channel family protein